MRWRSGRGSETGKDVEVRKHWFPLEGRKDSWTVACRGVPAEMQGVQLATLSASPLSRDRVRSQAILPETIGRDTTEVAFTKQAGRSEMSRARQGPTSTPS